jgi:hypothetical protein
VATQSEIADWLQALAGGRLAERRRLLQDLLAHPPQRSLTAADRLEPTREQVWDPPPSAARAPVSELRQRGSPPVRRVAIGLFCALLLLMAAASRYGRGRAPQVARPQPASLAAPEARAPVMLR